MAATIRDVARASGVHISTVSRAFTAEHLVNAETRRRVLAAAAQLGYRPNRAARGLITGRTSNIGLVIADIIDPFFPPLIKGAQARARDHDYHVFVADTDDDPAVEEELVQALAKQVDGIVLGSSRIGSRLIRQLRRSVPLVVMNRRVEGVPVVLMDLGRGVRLAVEYLTRLGHTRLALLAGSRDSWMSREIRQTASAAAEATGANLRILSSTCPSEVAGETAADELLHAGVTGVLAHSDLMAIGLMRQLGRLGLGVPGDLSVVVSDDIATGRLTHPELPTIVIPVAAAGRAAVDILLEDVGDPNARPEPMTLLSSLAVRDSTAAPAATRRSSSTGKAG